jgi:RecB family exonuclease
MTTLNNILQQRTHTKFATESGTKMHARLQRIFITPDHQPDNEITAKILSNPDLRRLFDLQSQTDTPIAGTIHNRFISRRIDRMRFNPESKTIEILDYKTDVNPNEFRTKYIAQIREYAELIHKIHPDHKIICYILWTHDFTLEKIK